MGRDRFCRLRRMMTRLATMTVERLNARVAWKNSNDAEHQRENARMLMPAVQRSIIK
jgi:hypothetical protein